MQQQQQQQRYSTTLTPFSLLTFLRVPKLAQFVCFPRIFFKLQSHRRLFPSPSDLEAWRLGRPMGHYSLLTFLRVQLGLFVSHEFSSNFKVIAVFSPHLQTWRLGGLEARWAITCGLAPTTVRVAASG